MLKVEVCEVGGEISVTCRCCSVVALFRCTCVFYVRLVKNSFQGECCRHTNPLLPPQATAVLLCKLVGKPERVSRYYATAAGALRGSPGEGVI